MSRSAEIPGAPAFAEEGLGVGIRADKEAHTLGRQLVRHFYSAAKAAEMFEFSNVVTREAVSTLFCTLRELLGDRNQLALRLASECLFMDESRLRFDFEGFAAFKFVVDSLKSRSLGAIVFRSGMTDDDLIRFLKVFIVNPQDTEEPLRDLEARLQEAEVSSIYVEEPRDLSERAPAEEVEAGTREASISTYFKSIFVAKQVMENLRGRRSIYLRKARRLVQSIVDLVTKEESTLLALTQIKSFDGFLFTHSSNVCVLSVALGHSLGLPKDLLSHLGMAALLHDVGLTEMPRELLYRPEALSPEERQVYESHAAIGALIILRNQGFTDASLRAAAVAFEHHMRADGSGFPTKPGESQAGFLSGIVAIVDSFDRLTTPQAEGDVPLTPEGALHYMLHEGREAFDPILVKNFVNTVGVYPLGSVVRLDTGEVGIVHARNPDPKHLFRPLLKITHDGNSKPVEPRILDLARKDPEKGTYLSTIDDVIPPTDYFEDVGEFTELL